MYNHNLQLRDSSLVSSGSTSDLLRQRMKKYDAPQQAQRAGVYPYFRAIESEQDTEVIIDGKKVLMFGSNSYLGLTNHPKIIEAAVAATHKYGTGCAGSRFLNGTLDIHIELEEKLARLVGKDAALCFSTGFQANLGAIPTLCGRSDYILLDAAVHASIIEASRLSLAKCFKFDHNNMQSLEAKLQHCHPGSVKIIAVDGIFSMDGDIADLPGIVALAEQYDATIMVDDAHAIGVLGTHGAGTASHFGLTDKTDLIMGTFSKSLASLGGFVAADFDTINYLKHHARSLIFSASMTPASAAAALAAIDIMQAEPERIETLWLLSLHALARLKQLGFDTGKAATPVIPIYIGDQDKTLRLSRALQDDGVFINPVLHPAVAKDKTMIRFSLMATHTESQVDHAIEKLYRHAKALAIL